MFLHLNNYGLELGFLFGLGDGNRMSTFTFHYVSISVGLFTV